MASQENHVEVIKVLLASGAKINLGENVKKLVYMLTFGELQIIDQQMLAHCCILLLQQASKAYKMN